MIIAFIHFKHSKKSSSRLSAIHKSSELKP